MDSRIVAWIVPGTYSARVILSLECETSVKSIALMPNAPYLMEHNRGALPGDTVLPVIVGGVHRRAAEQASHGARSIGAIISNAAPCRGRANVTSVVVGEESLDTHELRKQPDQLP